MTGTSYEHEQTAAAPVLAVLAVAAITTVLSALDDEGSTGFILGVGLLATAAAINFAGIRSRVDRTEVKAAFRFGWPVRSIPTTSIVGFEKVRNRWWYGFGIRLIPGGMLYSVWGLDAVEVRYDDPDRGVRMFRIGTDDPDGLAAAISSVAPRTR